MSGIRTQIMMGGLLLALGSLLACGSSSGDDSAADDDNDDTSEDDDAATDADAGGAVGGKPFTGKVVDVTDITKAVPDGLTVQLFDPETGKAYSGADYKKTSDGSGKVVFNKRPDGAGALVEGDDTGWIHTYNFQPATKGEEDILRVASVQSATLVPTLANFMADQERSSMAGNVLWHNDDTDKDEYVGCAMVSGDGVEDVRYIGTSGLPAVDRLEKGTQFPMGDKAAPTNANNAGKWYIANLAAGKQTVVATIDGEEMGTSEFFITARSEGSDAMGENATFHLGNIWVTADANPTPDDCK